VRFACLGSGSRGNAILVEGGDARILVDCGFPARELSRRLAPLGVDPESLDAILVTHEHGDHIRGVGSVARRYGLATWMTPGTYRGAGCFEVPNLRLFHGHGERFQIGGLEVLPYPIPHDAREPCQFVFRDNRTRLGLLTDAGTITPHIAESLNGCNGLLLECNHDPEMLRSGPYPPTLQTRVGGAFGHLSNQQAAGLLRLLDLDRVDHLVAAHLSEKNNTPALARQSLLVAAPAIRSRLSVARQDALTGWLELVSG